MSREGTRIMWESLNGTVIACDENQWIVADKAIKEKGNHVGEEYLRNHAYHGNLKTALIGASRRVAKNEATTLHEYIAIMQRTSDELRDALITGTKAVKG